MPCWDQRPDGSAKEGADGRANRRVTQNWSNRATVGTPRRPRARLYRACANRQAEHPSGADETANKCSGCGRVALDPQRVDVPSGYWIPVIWPEPSYRRGPQSMINVSPFKSRSSAWNLAPPISWPRIVLPISCLQSRSWAGRLLGEINVSVQIKTEM